MKRTVLRLFVAILVAAGSVHSQAPQPASSLLSQLQVIQAANKVLLEQQEKTLQTLEEMKTTSEQIKTFGKRG